MKTRNSSVLILSGLAAMLLATGCSSGGHRREVSQTERVYRDSDEVCRETTVTERGGRRADSDHRAAGTVAGAVVGGVVGHNVGSGSDAATVGGAAAGAVVGNQLGRDRDSDRRDSRASRSETRIVCRER